MGVNAVREGFLAWDAARQSEIVDQATSREVGEAKLAAYRASRERVVAGLIATYRAIAIASVLQSDQAALDAAVAIAAETLAIAQAFTEESP